MRFLSLSSTLLFASYVAGQLMVNTPASLIECEPAQITYSGGTAPYFLSVLPGGETGATPLEQFPEQATAGSYTWTVDIPAGTSITLEVRDSTGALNYAAPVTIISGTTTSCVNAAAAASATTAVTAVAPTTGPLTTVTAQPTRAQVLYFPSVSGAIASAFPSVFPSASYSLSAMGSGGPETTYAVLESGSVSAELIDGASAYIYSLSASGAQSTQDTYASCSISGTNGVCVYKNAHTTGTTTAPIISATVPIKKLFRFARE